MAAKGDLLKAYHDSIAALDAAEKEKARARAAYLASIPAEILESLKASAKPAKKQGGGKGSGSKTKMTKEEGEKLKAAITDILAEVAPSKDKGIKAGELKNKVHAKEPSIKESFINKVRNEMKGSTIESHGDKAATVWFVRGSKEGKSKAK